jgi:hypothetical protein
MSNSQLASGEQRPVIRVLVDSLYFDEENPRLASDRERNTQDEILKRLWTEMSVDEVALSIAANGYFSEEPLLVIPRTSPEQDSSGQKYTVVEGNRRLGAVILLRDETKRRAVGALDLPSITPARREELDRLPISIYRDRQELWAYFGFRHINGLKPWDAYSKAKYVATVHKAYRIPLTEIAEKIGDRHATVKRLYRGYEILQQALASTAFSLDDISKGQFYFSHLYTAVDQAEFQRLLGITSEGSLRPNPVPRAKLKELHELMLWLYGSKRAKKEPAVRTQNPDLNRLREVIANSRSLTALRSGLSLDRAYEIGLGDERRFREALVRAKEELQQAKATVTTGYTGQKDLDVLIDEILQILLTIKSEIEATNARRKVPGH